MKRIVLIMGVFVLGLGSLFVSAQQGVPSAKATASWVGIDYTPPVAGQFYEDTGLMSIIKTSEKADLILSLSAETCLGTNVKISGTGAEEISTSQAAVIARVEVYQNGILEAVAEPGEVTFGDRLIKLRGLLWTGSQVGMDALPTQFIELYMKTRDAHCFNFVVKDLDSGVHQIKVFWKSTWSGVATDLGDLTAMVGKRSMVVEAVRMVN